MKWSLYAGKVSGIKIYIHWTFLILIGWVIISGLRAGLGFNAIAYSVIFTLTIFLCVVLHELGHAIVAKRFRIITKDIILLPIGGMARMESLPEKPMQEFLIAIAGPIVNFVIAGILYFPLSLNGNPFEMQEFSQINEKNFLMLLLAVNVSIGVFNLIPAFPMDGGRILRALLSFRLPRYTATRIASMTGQFLAIVFIFIGFFYNPFLILIGAFIFLGAQAEVEYSRATSVLSGYKVKDVVMTHYYTVNANDPLENAIKLLLDVQAKDFLVMDKEKIVGTLGSNDMLKNLAQNGGTVPVKSAMQENVVFLDPEMPLTEVLKKKGEKNLSLMPVMENSHITGVVDFDNIIEFLLVKEAQMKK